jgi:D-alanyl-lipoteichoic acid acyltransferase DltB (MBOAT superfamily)
VSVFYVSAARWRRHVLLALSYLFYVSWSPAHAALLAVVTSSVYLAGRLFERQRDDRSRLRVLWLAVAGLLVLLVAFKSGELVIAAVRTEGDLGPPSWTIVLLIPLGLSYYVFRLIGYLVDVYWERIPVQRDAVSFALYVAFFPQIVSGPIQRAGDFFGQLEQLGHSDPAAIAAGLRRILFGLFKKLVVAETPAAIVVAAHSDPGAYSGLELLVAAYCFAFQLYADFSGLTDIAIGLGQLFGIRGPENFDRPFFAKNVQEFWRRWHMSLTSWLTDYVFTPLRMTFRRFADTGLAVAILCNMLAVGLWHGPRATYAIFGALNGAFLIVSAFTLKWRNAIAREHPVIARLRSAAGPVVTFHIFVFTLIFFRADSLLLALTYVLRLFSVDSSLPWTMVRWPRWTLVTVLGGIAFIEVIEWARRQPRWVARFLGAPTWVRWGVYYAGVAMVLLFATATRQFIYAQF